MNRDDMELVGRIIPKAMRRDNFEANNTPKRRSNNEKDYLQHHLYHYFRSGFGLERKLPAHVQDRGSGVES